MSWQLGSAAILGLALVAGFAWYERSRPDARIVALVGTLAALAALGRIAFAAVPNVKPTTDIVLISGYALGGGPGFAVGALAGLTSNFFFGQGPWTPWQMAAWGATGVFGAALALIPRRIGRWPLAVACGIAGFAFTAVQDVGDWVTYSDHSASALGLYVGQGLGFDAIHAAGCVVFALAFGPALARSLHRFAQRLSVEWVGAPPLVRARSAGPAVLVAVLATVTGGLLAGLTQPPRAAAASVPVTGGPVAYLLGAENRDGGFGPAPGQPSDPLYAGWAALGLASAGHRPSEIARGPHSVLAYLARTPAGDLGSAERTLLVLAASGVAPRAFPGGGQLLASVQRARRRDGSVSGQVNLTAFAILALRGLHVPPGRRTYRWLEAQQNRDGGFGYGPRGVPSDIDDTGAVLEALAAAPGAAASRAGAVAFLRAHQNRDGGWPSQPGQSSNAQSTAWAVQGLDAAGIAPETLRRGYATPIAYLHSLLTPSGSVRYAAGVSQTPVWVTAEVLMALENRPLPLLPARDGGRAGGGDRSPMGRISASVGVLTALVLAPLGIG